MTPVSPAEARPPPPQSSGSQKAFVDPSLSLNASPARIKVEGDIFSSQESQGIDDRPTKRRKLSVDSVQVPVGAAANTSAAKTTLVDDFRVLSTVLRGKPADDTEQESPDLPPLPKRPGQTALARKGEEETKPTHRARSLVPVPTAPDTTYNPDSAPRLSNNKHAAYFPWTGKHAEDNLNADNVKSGFYDRPPNPQEREMNTARVPLYNALKHRSGIESLSTLFSLVLEAKSKHGLTSSASTFKPPPRVTLAEAKRKSWISDLADANVPLRKLSRTIPQGIRGLGLLDQCIQNHVPLSRAIWFAKCVGANEIRTLKRKGTTPQAAVGTESKWLREWTINTEQFVESILTQVGQPLWKANVQYVLRLTTRLYLENLIDRDHFLDWIVKSFTRSSDDRLPFWLMVVHIYKQDITKFRKRGRLLAEALVDRYTTSKDWAHGMTQSLVKKLHDAIKGIALHRSYCFLMPDLWPTIRASLASCLDTNNSKEAQTLHHLDQVNERCMGSNKNSYLGKPSQKDRVVEVLDATKAPYDLMTLSSKLLAACLDVQELVVFCLEWATTQFRYGSARVYLISRLLRRWQRQGFDVELPVIQYLTSIHQSSTRLDFEALKHVFSDLSRSQTFSASKYLQYLNVRGLPRPGTIQAGPVPAASGQSLQQQICLDKTQVLMDLSTPRPSGHVTNLRNALLNRAGFDADAEANAVITLISHLQQDLNDLALSTQLDTARRKATEMLLSGWSWNVRGQISYWLRSFVADNVKDEISKKHESALQRLQSLSRGQYDIIRTALETLRDEAVLADIIGLCSSLEEEQLQASLVDTIARHADSFSAIGALESLQARFCQIYMSLRNVKLTMPLFATALLDLCAAFPSKYTTVNLLQQDLVRGDRGRAMAACSPFSDGIAESLQQAEATFIDDFEAVLQSEPSMHEQTMNRLFALLTDRIEKQQGTIIGEDALFSYCQLMARLRLCRKHQGDQLLKTWLTKALSKYAATFTRNLVYSLIGTGCLTIDILVEAITTIGRKTVVAHHGWLVSPNSASEHPCAYAATTKWINFGLRKPQEGLNLLGHAVEPDRSPYERLFCTSFILRKLQNLAMLSEASRRMLVSALQSLLGTEKAPELLISSTLRSLDIFSIRFVQAQLQLQASGKAEEENIAIANAMVDLVGDPSRSPSSMTLVSSLLETSEERVANAVRQVVEDRVLDMLPKLPSGKSAEGAFDPDTTTYLKLAVDQAFELCPKTSSPSGKSNQKLIDALLQILKYLGNAPSSTAVPRTPTATSPTSSSLPLPQSIASQIIPTSPMDGANRPACALLLEYLRVLLQLLCLQRPSNAPASTTAPLPPPPKQSSDIKILAHLSSIVTHPAIASLPLAADSSCSVGTREVVDFAYDVMATYVDDLSDEARILLSRILRDKLKDDSDFRLRRLFGSINMCGSDIAGAEELGKGLLVVKRDSDGVSKGKVLGEWRPRVWEVLETGGRGDADVSVGLGMFSARRV